MAWTNASKLEYLMRLPWTLTVERVTDEGNEPYRVVRVREIPSALAVGSDDEELTQAFWESLRESLTAYLENDDEIPLPLGARLPWVNAVVAESVGYGISMESVPPRVFPLPMTGQSQGLQYA